MRPTKTSSSLNAPSVARWVAAHSAVHLLFVPLRHLAFQGEVDDPKVPDSAFHYDTHSAFISRVRGIIAKLRSAEGGRLIADQLRPFLSTKYYYMFEEGGQGLADYSAYILGAEAGISRGLNPDFGTIELMIEDEVSARFLVHEGL